MEISTSTIKQISGLMNEFDDFAIRSTGSHIDFFFSNKEVTTSCLIRILHKTKVAKFIQKIDKTNFALLNTLGSSVKLKFSNTIKADDGKSSFEIPYLEIDPEFTKLVEGYLSVVEFEGYENTINNILKMRKKSDDDIEISESFDLDFSEMNKIIKFSKHLKQEFIHITADGKKLEYKSYDNDLKANSKIQKSGNTFDKLFKRDHLKMFDVIKDLKITLFNTEDSPMVVYGSDENLKICMFISAMDDDNKK